jgi:hypothetical protein
MGAMAQNAYYFKDAPLVVEVPYAEFMRAEDQGMAAGAFSRSAAALKSKDGSILSGLLKKYVVGVDVRSITLVGFSVGGVFVNEVMKSSDADRIDGVVCLDSLVFNLDWRGNPVAQEIGHWIDFGEKAAKNRRLLVLAHTEIASPAPKLITTTAAAAEALVGGVSERVASDSNINSRVPALDLQSFLLTPPPPPVQIVGGSTVPTKTFTESPLSEWHQWGNFWTFNYGGRGPADHIYVAWYAQRDIWAGLLAPRLNSGVQCSSGVSGLGAASDEGCQPSRELVPEGTFETGSYLTIVAAFLGGIAAGTAAGFIYGRRIGA